MLKNNQDYQSILILIIVRKNPIENLINFSLGSLEMKIESKPFLTAGFSQCYIGKTVFQKHEFGMWQRN